MAITSKAAFLTVTFVAQVLLGHAFVDNDLSGIRVDGNQFVNHANQPVKLRVSLMLISIQWILNHGP